MQKQLVEDARKKTRNFLLRARVLAVFVRDILTKIHALVPLFSLSLSLSLFFLNIFLDDSHIIRPDWNTISIRFT